MAVNWTLVEHEAVQRAVAEHPANSGRCAVVARRVHRVGIERDSGNARFQSLASFLAIPRATSQPNIRTVGSGRLM